jgi:hypothetical protein
MPADTISTSSFFSQSSTGSKRSHSQMSGGVGSIGSIGGSRRQERRSILPGVPRNKVCISLKMVYNLEVKPSETTPSGYAVDEFALLYLRQRLLDKDRKRRMARRGTDKEDEGEDEIEERGGGQGFRYRRTEDCAGSMGHTLSDTRKYLAVVRDPTTRAHDRLSNVYTVGMYVIEYLRAANDSRHEAKRRRREKQKRQVRLQ